MESVLNLFFLLRLVLLFLGWNVHFLEYHFDYVEAHDQHSRNNDDDQADLLQHVHG